jgi:dipeptidase E
MAQGEVSATLVTANGLGLTEFAVIPHFQNSDHFAGSLSNTEKWADKLPVPVYAIDDETAIKVTDGSVEVVSEGQWKLFSKQ